MIEIRPYAKLGSANHGWLNAKHHFSFANYYDANRIHWGQLRVWNDDTISPHNGFSPHPHEDMEIITYVYQGAITHKDSMGNEGRTEAGDVQIMSAGTGVIHSEYNLEDQETKLFQIWIIPDKKGNKPTWGTRSFPKAERHGQFSVLASGYPEDSSALPIQVNAKVLAITLKAGQSTEYTIESGKKAYLVAAKGRYQVNGHDVNAHDGVAVKDEKNLMIQAIEDSEIVMVEVF